MSGQAVRVLVVDDDEDLREYVCDALASDGFEVYEAPDGRRCIGIMEALKAGANNYIVKPFTPEALKEKLCL